MDDDAAAVAAATNKRTRAEDDEETRRGALDFDVSSSFLTTSFESLSKSSTKENRKKETACGLISRAFQRERILVCLRFPYFLVVVRTLKL